MRMPNDQLLTLAVDEVVVRGLVAPGLGVNDALCGVAGRVEGQHGDVHVVPHLGEVANHSLLPQLFTLGPEHTWRR